MPELGQDSSVTTHSVCKISGGPVHIVVPTGIRVSPFPHAATGFRVQHFSDAGLSGPTSHGVDRYLAALGSRFSSGYRRTDDAVEGEQSEGTLRSSPAFLTKTAIATADTPL